MKLFDPGKLRRVAWWEYAERFLLGACISGIAAIAGQTLGDKIGGALLAFPAVLPASLTLAWKKDGRTVAEEHERGALFGGIGLLAFAITIGLAARPLGGWAIAAGVVAWVAAAFGSYFVAYGAQGDHGIG